MRHFQTDALQLRLAEASSSFPVARKAGSQLHTCSAEGVCLHLQPACLQLVAVEPGSLLSRWPPLRPADKLGWLR